MTMGGTPPPRSPFKGVVISGLRASGAHRPTGHKGLQRPPRMSWRSLEFLKAAKGPLDASKPMKFSSSLKFLQVVKGPIIPGPLGPWGARGPPHRV